MVRLTQYQRRKLRQELRNAESMAEYYALEAKRIENQLATDLRLGRQALEAHHEQ